MVEAFSKCFAYCVNVFNNLFQFYQLPQGVRQNEGFFVFYSKFEIVQLESIHFLFLACKFINKQV